MIHNTSDSLGLTGITFHPKSNKSLKTLYPYFSGLEFAHTTAYIFLSIIKICIKLIYIVQIYRTNTRPKVWLKILLLMIYYIRFYFLIHCAMDKKTSETKAHKAIQNRWIFPFLFFIVFWLSYLAYFLMTQKDLLWNIPADMMINFSSNPILSIFVAKPVLIWLFWFAFGLISMLATYILKIIKLLWMRRCNACNPIIFAVAYSVRARFWRRLLYREPNYTDIAVFIINSVWKPVFYIWSWAVAICVLWFILSVVFYIVKKTK